MKFEDLKIKEIITVAHYNTNMKSWRAKDRKNHFIGIKLEGSALHDFGYKKFVLSGNSVYYFNQRDNYDVTVYEAGASFSVHFTTEEEIDSESFAFTVANPTEFISLLKKADAAKRSGDGHLLYSYVYRILWEIAKQKERAYVPSDRRVTAFKEYIDGHISEADCLSSAVSHSKLSSRRIGSLFKTSFGVTPNRYLTLRRIERAKELLSVEGISVAEVAELSGFSDVYYFSKVFKAATGVSPGRFK
jgi:AraC-like DNA-binding protein